MQFEYEAERLIDEVKKRPGLWNFEDLNYRNKEARHKLWTEVVHELLDGSVKISKSDMRELVIQLQKKWKSIRDAFQKYIQNPNRTRRPYIYSKQLHFLLRDSLPTEEANSSDSEDTTKKKPNTWKNKKKIKLIKDEEQESDDVGDDHDYQEESLSFPAEVEVPPKIPRTSNFVDDFAFASVDSNRSEGDDPDKMFLLSLLPHLKAIPEECRLNVKMDMMQVLRNASYNSETVHKIL